MTVSSLHYISRPSLSADGTKIVVQASASAAMPPQDLNIYVIDLQTGQPLRVSLLAVNEESPEWVPGQNKVAYSSFSPTGIDLHIHDLDSAQETLRIPGAGGIHIALSPDGQRILETGRMRLYSASDGSQVADLQSAIVQALQPLGYELDDRYPWQANRGTFPLDGSFSEDGRSIVFDGAVKKAGIYGVILGRVTIAGGELEVLSDLVSTNPAYSNNHNYSQLNPAARKTTAVTAVGAVFSTAQTSTQSFLRFYNTGTSAGTATVTLRDFATGQSLGQWTTPIIPGGAEPQFSIGAVESGIGAFTKPTYYSVFVQSGMTGHIQHVLFRSADGTLTNLSTCGSGITADPVKLSGVHTSRLNNWYPNSVVVNNTGANAATVSLGIYDARNGARLGTATTASIPANGHVIVTVTALELAANVSPSAEMFHYVIKVEGTFDGFLQHLVNNQSAGVITDMTTACRLGAVASPAASPLRLGAIFSTIQTGSQSFLRFYNTGTAAGTASVTLRDPVTGLSLGQWTSPSIPGGAEQQYAIGTIESGIGSFVKPSYYSVSIQSAMNGHFQHVLFRSADGTLTNLSTCGSGITADPSKLSGVHSSLLDNGYPSSVAITNTAGAATTASFAIYDARNGTQLGSYTSASIPAYGQAILSIASIEAAANISPSAGMFHYVITAQGAFTGFLQHLVNNQSAGVITDMTTACALAGP